MTTYPQIERSMKRKYENKIEENYHGKLVYDFGRLYEWGLGFGEIRFDISLREKDNQQKIVIKKTFDMPDTEPSYFEFNMENAEKLRDFLTKAIKKRKSPTSKPK